jgi:integrase
MGFSVGHIPAHKGRASATTPLKSLEDVSAIKNLLQDKARDLALFTVGVNTAFRAGDLLNLRRDEDVTELEDGRIELISRESKTGKIKRVILNMQASDVLRDYLQNSTGKYVFEGQRGKMSVSYVTRLLKSWAGEAGIEGKIATHTMRKTFVRLQHDVFGTKMSTLMFALNHSNERQTLAYMGRLSDDVESAYQNVI